MNKQTKILFALLSVSALSVPIKAQASKKVYAPYSEKGEVEIEYRSGYDIDANSDKDGAWKQKFAIGYGISNYWFTEIYAEFKKSGKKDAEFDFNSIEWENRFLLTEPGKYWLDFGLLTELKYNVSGGADKGELKFLFAKDVNKFTHLANVILEREFGEEAGNETEVGFAWSGRYRYKPYFEPAIEIHSNFGSLSDGSSFDEETHQFGPVAYGKLGNFKYDAGVLFGISDNAPDATLKAIIEYEWRF